MLHDPSHYEPPISAEPIRLNLADQEILRGLAAEWARLAADPVNGERRELWRRLNDRDSVRPMVWINEIPWHEMDVDGELALLGHGRWLRPNARVIMKTPLIAWFTLLLVSMPCLTDPASERWGRVVVLLPSATRSPVSSR
jgi:hypothetical protein